MRYTKTVKYYLAFAIFLSAIFSAFLPTDSAFAYQCRGPVNSVVSSTNSSLTWDGYKNDPNKVANMTPMVYKDGACYVSIPDDRYTPSVGSDGVAKCRASDPMIDGSCYTMREYQTTNTPTKNNGSPADANAWSCGAGDKYDSSRHACVEQDCGGFDGCALHPPSQNVDDTSKVPLSNYTDKSSCEAAGGNFALTQRGSGGAADTWTCVSPKKYIESAQNQQECESRGGAWGTTSVSQNSASAGSKSCTAPAGTQDDSDSQDSPVAPMSPTNPPATGNGQCGKAKTNIISCKGEGAQAFGDLLKQLLSLLTMGVGILAVGGILFGAIMYASAQDNAGQVQKAIGIITNTVIGLLLYIFMFAIANWLVPGGVIQ